MHTRLTLKGYKLPFGCSFEPQTEAVARKELDDLLIHLEKDWEELEFLAYFRKCVSLPSSCAPPHSWSVGP